MIAFNSKGWSLTLHPLTSDAGSSEEDDLAIWAYHHRRDDHRKDGIEEQVGFAARDGSEGPAGCYLRAGWRWYSQDGHCW
jgi:hypothetical protein